MKTEKRKYQIVKGWKENCFNPSRGIYYNGKTCLLSAGDADKINVFRYDNDHFFVLTSNYRLKYAGFELINIVDMEVIADGFFQNTDEVEMALDLKKPFFDYTENKQADILNNWVY